MRLLEASSDDEVKAAVQRVLSAHMRDVDVPVPSTVVRSSWHSNRYIAGAYSYYSHRMDVEGVDYEHIARPIPQQRADGRVGRMFFASHQCSPAYRRFLWSSSPVKPLTPVNFKRLTAPSTVVDAPRRSCTLRTKAPDVRRANLDCCGITSTKLSSNHSRRFTSVFFSEAGHLA